MFTTFILLGFLASKIYTFSKSTSSDLILTSQMKTYFQRAGLQNINFLKNLFWTEINGSRSRYNVNNNNILLFSIYKIQYWNVVALVHLIIIIWELETIEYWMCFEWNKRRCMYVHWRIYSSRDLDTLLHKVEVIWNGNYSRLYTSTTIDMRRLSDVFTTKGENCSLAWIDNSTEICHLRMSFMSF